MRNCAIVFLVSLFGIIGAWDVYAAVVATTYETGTGTQTDPYTWRYSSNGAVVPNPVFYDAPSGAWYDPLFVEVFDILPDPSTHDLLPLFDKIQLPVDGTVTVGSTSTAITADIPFDFTPDVSSFTLSYDPSFGRQPLEIWFTPDANGNPQNGNFSETTVPLPSAAFAGMALLGVLGLYRKIARR